MLIEKHNLDQVSRTDVLNRKGRRMWGKLKRKAGQTKLPEVSVLMPEKQILMQEDDISVLKKEVKQYELAQSDTLAEIHIYNAFLNLGITDSNCKRVIVKPDSTDPMDMEDVEKNILREIQNEDQGLIRNVLSAVRMMLSPRKKTFYDQDEVDLINRLAQDNSIKGIDILKEVKRARQESIDLMEMQIKWLKEKQAPPKQKENNVEKTNELPKIEEELPLVVFQNIPEELPETQTNLKQEEIEQEFLLKGWELLFSESTRLSDPSDLINVPTNSRQDALDVVAKLTRRIVSVKPNTILRALEFYLKKDVIQKALASRIKHAKDKWIKITRGGYRILLLIPDPDKERAIFFVDARSSSYEHL